MRNNVMLAVLLFASSFLLSGCEALGDIFKAGMWVGVIFVSISSDLAKMIIVQINNSKRKGKYTGSKKRIFSYKKNIIMNGCNFFKLTVNF